MDLALTPEQEEFRESLRAWLAENPPSMSHGTDEELFPERRAWQRSLYEAGWLGITWPERYGGRGASRTEQAIVIEELALARAPRLANDIALEMGGPTILTHGTEAQKERFLRPMLSAEEIWCQAFSEPDAGSDLAALRTSARAVDGGYVLSGQKVWTSLAHLARWCMLLCRSEAGTRAHRGLSFILVDMRSDGIEIRPIVQMTGEAEFNEVFFNDVFVPEENLLGAPGEGWRVATTTLMNERGGIALQAQVTARAALDELTEQVAGSALAEDPVVGERLAQLHVECEGLRLLTYRGLTEIDRDGIPGPRGSLAKWQWAEVNQAICELAVDLLGPAALDAGSPWGYRYLRSRANSIEGGTTEILQNVIAERVLGLPRLR